MSQWVLVADRVQASLYEQKGQSFTLLREIDHPEGRARDEALEGARPHRTYDRHAHGRAAADRGDSPHERAAKAFARTLASVLEKGRQETDVERIVLVAEPHLLGLLRSALDPTTARLVVGSVAKDPHGIRRHDLPSFLQGALSS